MACKCHKCGKMCNSLDDAGYCCHVPIKPSSERLNVADLLESKMQVLKERHDFITLVNDILSVVQIGLLRGQFAGMSDLEGFTRAMDVFTRRHETLVSAMKNRIALEQAAKEGN